MFKFNYAAKITLAAVIGFLALTLAFSSFHVVPSGHVGVQRTMGEVNHTILQEGPYFINPFSSVYNYEATMQATAAKNALGGSKDQQVVHTDITVNYSFDPSKAAYTYQRFGKEDYIEKSFINPAIFEVFKAVTSMYTSEELTGRRSSISTEIVTKLQAKLAKYNIIISDINLVNFGFSQAYQAAIENKVIATQRKEQAITDLARIQTEANQAIAIAEGRAKAISIETQAINGQGGDAYVRMKSIEKWNGVLPATMAGNAVPFVNVK